MSVDILKSVINNKRGIARLNRFMVELPVIAGAIPTFEEMVVLCKTASIPGKGIATHDRSIMTENEKTGYGYIVQEMPMSFYLLNDYGMRDYFDTWMNSIVNQDTHEVSYKTEYQRSIRIHQLFFPVESRGLASTVVEASNIQQNKIYSIELVDAFPTTLNSIEFTNDPDVIGEVSVSIAYTKWRRI